MAIHIQRREFIGTLGGAAAWPLAAWAQQPKVRRIGVLMNTVSDDAEGQARLAAFHQGLQQLGWTVGHNVQIDYRWGGDDAERTRRGAAELIALGSDAILASGTPSVAALQQAGWTDGHNARIQVRWAGPTSSDASGAPGSKRDRAGGVVVIAIAAVAVNFGAGVGLMGWGALQALGLVAEPAIESVRRKQTALMSQLDTTVHALTAAVVGLSARVYSAGEREDAASLRMAEIDDALGDLRTGMDELRAAQNAAKESWRKPVAELAAAAKRTRGDIVRLRASLDELSEQGQLEAVVIGGRLDRIEKAMVQRNLLAPLRGSIH